MCIDIIACVFVDTHTDIRMYMYMCVYMYWYERVCVCVHICTSLLEQIVLFYTIHFDLRTKMYNLKILNIIP